MKKYFILFCLAGAIAFAPVCPANARYHYGNRIVAAAVGGAVVGLVGAVVQSALNPNGTVVMGYPAYTYVEPVPFVVYNPVVMREPHYYRPTHHHSRHHYRHR